MDSWLKARLARLGPIRGIDRVSSGSPATFVLRLPPNLETLRTIDATYALARRGLTMLRAKRLIEALVEEGRVSVSLPTVEDNRALIRDLACAGIEAVRLEISEPATPGV